MRKKISVVIPTYNEEANVVSLSQAIIEVMEKDLSEYDYEILFIDNHSKDNTKALLRGLCANNRKIKAIFNAKNFGQARSPVYGMKQAYGDCVVRMCADFQDPVDMIPKFVREWEKGTKIVIGVKSASKERRGMYLVRECYYRLINKITDIDHIDQFTGFVCMTENLWMLYVICMIRCRIFEALLLSLDLIIKRLNIHSQSGVQEKAKIISTVFMIMQ